MNIQLEDICKLVGLILGAQQVEGDHRILEDLQAQSLDVMNIIISIERKYGIAIEDEVLARISTVDDLYRLVLQRAGT